jgi:glutathione S-transferase
MFTKELDIQKYITTSMSNIMRLSLTTSNRLLLHSFKAHTHHHTMSSLKPVTIHGKRGPNPSKVRMLVEEIGLPYELHDVDFAVIKEPEYLAVNPNGRIPAIHDPNNNLTLWESGAIIEYLIEKYDTERKLSFEPGSKEAYLAKQWLFFQGT